MKDGRKTTFEERVEIASYCIEHNHNYAETAAKYKVSYQQARSYTVKYEEGGVDALQDRRVKRKDVDSLSEIERLKEKQSFRFFLELRNLSLTSLRTTQRNS